MLRRMDLNGFKCWRKKASFKLRPLTILTGANSSGKSSVIQAILMAAQTVQSSSHESSVVLNGPLARMGSFHDVVSEGKTSMGFAFELDVKAQDAAFIKKRRLSYVVRDDVTDVRSRRSLLAAEVKFELVVPSASKKSLSTLDPPIQDSTITLTYSAGAPTVATDIGTGRVTFGARHNEARASVRSRVEQEELDEPYDAIPEALYSPIGAFPGRLAPWERTTGDAPNARLEYVTMLHFLPEHAIVAYEESAKLMFQLRDSLGLEPYSEWHGRMLGIRLGQTGNAFILSMNTVLKSIRETYVVDPATKEALNTAIGCHQLDAYYVDSLKKCLRGLPSPAHQELLAAADEWTKHPTGSIEKKGPSWNFAYRRLDDSAEAGVKVLRDFFRDKIRYLGPLREEPRAFYPEASAPDAKDVGIRGERTAEVLYAYRGETVTSVNPSISDFRSGQTERVPLTTAVRKWLQFLGVADWIGAQDKGVLGFALEASAPGQSARHGLIHLGTGVSQVLPILVMALLAPTGSLLMFEQPELHLHPKVQARLADFFYAMTVAGKQCLVETHSEYIVDRLRYLCAAGEAKSVSNNAIIYFVENTPSGSTFRSIKIDEEGGIPDWPDGFFDESQHLSLQILNAGLGKRQRPRGDGK